MQMSANPQVCEQEQMIEASEFWASPLYSSVVATAGWYMLFGSHPCRTWTSNICTSYLCHYHSPSLPLNKWKSLLYLLRTKELFQIFVSYEMKGNNFIRSCTLKTASIFQGNSQQIRQQKLKVKNYQVFFSKEKWSILPSLRGTVCSMESSNGNFSFHSKDYPPEN